MKMTPSIRFNGFDDDWEQRKLSSTVERVIRKNTELESTLPLTVSAQYGLVNQTSYFNNRVASQNISNYYLVRKGEFAYNKSSSDAYPFGAVKRLDLYDMGVLSTLYIVFAIKDPNVDSDFLTCYYDTGNWHKQVYERATEGARNHGLLNISAEDFLDTDFMIPSDIKEQGLIGAYLKKLDALVSLHQHKYEKMSGVLLSMREKLFAKPNTPFPENRFGGFSDAWQWRKLGDIADKVTERNTDSAISETFTNSAEFGVISQRRYFNHDITNVKNIDGYYIIRPQDFVYNPRISTSAPVGPINRNRLGRCGIVSPLYTVFRTHHIDPVFLEWYFKSPYWHQFMYYYGNTGARHDRFSIADEVFFEMPIPWTEIEEQKKIGQVLENIASLIMLYRQKLEKLKNVKAACLEGMFV